MACLHPLKGFPTGLTKDGKTKLTIAPYKIKAIGQNGERKENVGIEKTDIVSYYEIPCGHCVGCRKDQAQEWSNRLIMEMDYHDSAYFLTLTYDEAHVHRICYTDELTGELKDDRGTLNKRDFQLFIKELRRYRPDDKIRYYLCGEYGGKTERPHGHAILFGLHLGDWCLVESGTSETGSTYYTCPQLEKIWKRGFISIEPANEYTCKYVCNYVTKKLGNKPNKYYEERGQVPPFSLSSRKPGIGRKYFEDKGDEMFKYDKIFLATTQGSVEIRPPRYFKKLYRESHEEEYQRIVYKHLQAGADADDAKTTITDLHKLEQLKNKENIMLKSLSNRDKI